ncbi:ABC transporter substrate-binding protein [Halospina sp. K52047b]|uniref:ABC transporter substrate-binding protein n=1 Tax=Halospina sp. K52047b TaxID=2614160 RepID=UPI00124A46ED|nr:ABC transporter substrate-binding protein [Halospina sp. K52047b]KAA8983418.1 ABC transporter substrate-binding protein [Halospina sp. K52047b]
MKTLKALTRAFALAALGAGFSAGALAESTVNIGFSGPLSGGAAVYGENVLSGLEMAVDEINSDGGVEIDGETHKVTLESLDDMYSPAETATNAKRLTQESNVSAIFVPHTGGIFALQDFNVKDNFLIMAYTSTPTVTEQGNPLTVRIPPTFDGYVKVFTDYAMKEHGKKLGMAGATHEYAKIWAKMLEKEWKAQGGEVVAKNPMSYNKSADFYTGVSRTLAASPDVLFVGGASEPTGLVVQQANQLGFKGGYIVMDQAKLDEMADVAGGIEALNGAVGVTPLSIYESESAKAFIKRYQERYDKMPGSEAAYNYLALHGLVKAMQLAGSTDAKAAREHIAQAMVELDKRFNPYDVTEVTDKGGFVTETTMAVVEDGELVQKEVNLD